MLHSRRNLRVVPGTVYSVLAGLSGLEGMVVPGLRTAEPDVSWVWGVEADVCGVGVGEWFCGAVGWVVVAWNRGADGRVCAGSGEVLGFLVVVAT